ncbi:hypothetical protein J3Q64DRAFT_1696657 [Phycomyces blakesleeanus]|uniref:Uncharacterized protein n=2 Tax=Phycomyces blakesleeanus TaxID=4837 RepID=A0A162XSK8_PHYB8|nr:hypothetical protein PHYBLDRAFT_59839 [Phycomyces blakesleeanus NRRL 1555(-)]OAD76305.1 hypothetical protein PHYBLDRAFT_59839 [Phycomyces blakesleeanus NRRL 1555(-)]|eukprot:XP_018294345.1 hypothetical protein PHYBLDRAFT_59839 [Phycomyces blakesleeanus NRRL 1555(-)]
MKGSLEGISGSGNLLRATKLQIKLLRSLEFNPVYSNLEKVTYLDFKYYRCQAAFAAYNLFQENDHDYMGLWMLYTLDVQLFSFFFSILMTMMVGHVYRRLHVVEFKLNFGISG